MKRTHSLSALGLALLLAACSSEPVRQVASVNVACPPPQSAASAATEAASYYAFLGTLHASDLVEEYDSVNRRFLKSGDDLDRVKLAMLQALPDTPLHNTAAARDLLAGLDKSPRAAADLRDFAHLLDRLLDAQQRAEAAASDLAQSLAAEKAHSRSLQGKIDAIKNMEINSVRKDAP